MERPSNRDKYTIIIPAAGLGKRMKTYGPKSLININDEETILSRQIDSINAVFKKSEIIIVGGYEHHKLNSNVKNTRFIYNDKFETTNVLYSIGVGLSKAKTDKILVVYGDLVFNNVCLNLPFYKESAVVISSGMKEEEIGCIYHDGILENMFHKLPKKWAQIAFFTGYELKLLKEIIKEPKGTYWFGFEAINNIISKGGTFKVFEPDNGFAVDIDSSHDLKLLENLCDF